MSSSSNDNVVQNESKTLFVNVKFITTNILPFSDGSIYNLISQDRLPFPHYKIGGKVCFKRKEVMDWAETIKDPRKVRIGRPTKAEEIARRESKSQLSNSHSQSA